MAGGVFAQLLSVREKLLTAMSLIMLVMQTLKICIRAVLMDARPVGEKHATCSGSARG